MKNGKNVSNLKCRMTKAKVVSKDMVAKENDART
jgi:hypothetical protein